MKKARVMRMAPLTSLKSMAIRSTRTILKNMRTIITSATSPSLTENMDLDKNEEDEEEDLRLRA